MKNKTCNLTSNLYSPRFEHDACGIGAVVDTQGRPSHETVDRALKIVEKLEHRAGKDASGETGDGVGILVQISHRFFSAVLAELGVTVGQARSYAVGMFFLPQDRILRARRQKLFEILAEKAGLPVLLWRPVPVEPEILGQRAVDCMPSIWQPILARPADAESDLEFDRRLYIMRREFEQSVSDTYVASLSCRTIVYKGMFLVNQLRLFYPDLQDERFASAIALVHSRFSTNTNPSWERAHPNRLLLHNGEINTIRGNLSRMLAREETMHSPPLDHAMEKILPVVDPSGSDSAMLDNALEFLLYSGMDLPKAVMLTIPEPWSQNRDMPRAIQDMYHYYATMMEPWDGPAAILFSDGDVVGACLDRNGLRPIRYYLTDDGTVILASEVGVLELDEEHILKKERLHPGIQRMTALIAGENEAAQRAAVKRAVRVENLAAEFCTNRGQRQPARLRQRAGELIAVDDGGAERFQRERNGGFSTGNTACQTDDAHEDSSFRRAKRIFNRTIQRGKRLQISAKSSDRRSKTPRQGVFSRPAGRFGGKSNLRFQQLLFEVVFHLIERLFGFDALGVTLLLDGHYLADGVDEALVRLHERLDVDDAALGFLCRLDGAHFERLGVLLQQLVGHVRDRALRLHRLLRVVQPKRQHHLVLPQRQRVGNGGLNAFHQ